LNGCVWISFICLWKYSTFCKLYLKFPFTVRSKGCSASEQCNGIAITSTFIFLLPHLFLQFNFPHYYIFRCLCFFVFQLFHSFSLIFSIYF
jgi:hypothetical protein